ncbi:hypothetical protein CHS0354_010878 [Potamilus streckersoni]|uniref:PDZ domain-containing protein n=2 Tax=Potamilus streckersoni TaxID=2493646 RepID=A0AAE0SP47_9BIVA|nr:hypothetical protein CHS0354_010878 [Potamilus streckersoni]
MLFFRFKREDDSYMDDKDLKLFFIGWDLFYSASSKTNGIFRNYDQNGERYRNAFFGSQLVDHLIIQGEAKSRIDAALLGRRLLEHDIIRHVTDDHHFRDDDHLLYQFSYDFQQKRKLSDVFKFVKQKSASLNDSCMESNEEVQIKKYDIGTKDNAFATKRNSVGHESSSIDTADGDTGSYSSHRTASASSTEYEIRPEISEEICAPASVLLRYATVEELESPDTPYVKQSIKISSDPVGFGFVIRGNSPTYVQTIDPLGPAAVAGLKVRQYIYSVNGINVLYMNHKEVAKMMMKSRSYVNLVVMTHKRGTSL